MWKVGARELKTRLGSYLQRVRQGATLIVTERGRPVAELRPVDPALLDLSAGLSELVASGLLAQGAREPRALRPFTPIVNRGASVAEAVIEGREDRF